MSEYYYCSDTESDECELLLPGVSLRKAESISEHSFILSDEPFDVLKRLTDILNSQFIPYEISTEEWKLLFTMKKATRIEGSERAQLIETKIQIELLSHDNDVCVEFEIQRGSHELFEEWYNRLKT